MLCAAEKNYEEFVRRSYEAELCKASERRHFHGEDIARDASNYFETYSETVFYLTSYKARYQPLISGTKNKSRVFVYAWQPNKACLLKDE